MKQIINILLLLFTSIVFAQLETNMVSGGEAFSRGRIVEIGINDQGVFGALNASKPVGYHDNRAGSLFGFIANPQDDGWIDYDGDFFTPGHAEEGFSLEINGVNYRNNNHNINNEIPGAIIDASVVVDPCFADFAQIIWQGSVAGLEVTRKYGVTEDGLFIQMITEVTNTNSTTAENVFWMHNIDPDNNKTINGIYDTTNTIISQPSTGNDNIALVSGNQDAISGVDSDGSSVSFYAKNVNARVSVGGFDNDEASTVWNGGGAQNLNITEGYSEDGDIAMSIAFKLGDILPDETKVFRYFYFTVNIDESVIPDIPFIEGVNPSSCDNDDGLLIFSGLIANTDYTISYNDDNISIAPQVYTANALGEIMIDNLDKGLYDNFVISTGVCTSTATVSSVSLFDPLDANAGSDATYDLCGLDEVINLFKLLGNNPDLNGLWSPSLSSGTGVFDSTVDPLGVYTYTVSPLDCGVSSATVTINSSNFSLSAQNHTETVCDDDYFYQLDGQYSFNLESLIPNMITDPNGVSYSFYEAADVSTSPYIVDVTSEINTPTAYINTTGVQTIFVEFENNNTGCTIVKLLTLRVLPNPTPLESSLIEPMFSCVNDGNGLGTVTDGYALFDFTNQYNLIFNNESGDVSLHFYTSYDNAVNQINEILNIQNFYNTIPFNQIIYVNAINNTTNCNTIVEFQIAVPAPTISIEGEDILCLNEAGLPLYTSNTPILSVSDIIGDVLSNYTFEWFLNGVLIPGANINTLTIFQPGKYTIVATHILDVNTNYDDTKCYTSDSVIINASYAPLNTNANVITNAFNNNQQIIVNVTSSSDSIYNFILDNDISTANEIGIFDDVKPGVHIVTIADELGCWTENIELSVIDYPRFFTPNGDGVNDYWKIYGQDLIPITQIFIYDRFGKLIKQLDPDSIGWDGTYNGNALPATDYWFTIIYIEEINGVNIQKEFNSNFSLAR